MNQDFFWEKKKARITIFAAAGILILSGCGKNRMAEEGNTGSVADAKGNLESLAASSEATVYKDVEKTDEEIKEEALNQLKSIDFGNREYPIDDNRYDAQTDKIYKEAFREAVTNQVPIWCPDRGEAVFYQELLLEAGKLDDEAFQREVRQSDYFYLDYDGDGLPELIINTEGPCVLKYRPESGQVELYRQKEPDWNLLGCGQMLYEWQGWLDDSYQYLYGYESEDSKSGLQTVMFRELLNHSPAEWEIRYQVSVDAYEDIVINQEQMYEIWQDFWDSYKRVPHPMSFFALFEENGQGYLPGSQIKSRYWLEDTQPLPVNEEEGEEWEQYKRMMEGDFSLVEDEMWGSLQGRYEDSLKKGNGICGWDYFLMDFDQDGSKELVLRFFKEGVNNTASFRYVDGKVKMWGGYNSADSHGYSVPLANGKILSVSWYQDNKEWWIERLDSNGYCVKEKNYGTGVRKEELDDPRDLENTDPNEEKRAGERYYFFLDYYHNGQACGYYVSLTEKEWEQVEAMVEGLLLPEEVWKPCSVFTPMEERPEIPSVG